MNNVDSTTFFLTVTMPAQIFCCLAGISSAFYTCNDAIPDGRSLLFLKKYLSMKMSWKLFDDGLPPAFCQDLEDRSHCKKI